MAQELASKGLSEPAHAAHFGGTANPLPDHPVCLARPEARRDPPHDSLSPGHASPPLPLDLPEDELLATVRLQEAAAAAPDVGTEFLGFRLVAELGRGAFGRVYLARQEALADRQVILKVSADMTGEAATLAQLLHTNVVPVYSIHHNPPLQAVCMPYLGRTTLADVLKEFAGRASLPSSGKVLVSTLHERKSSTPPAIPPGVVARSPDRATGSTAGLQHAEETDSRSGWHGQETVPQQVTPLKSSPDIAYRAGEIGSTILLEKLAGLSYVDAILWLAARLADGLAHAHERGILHRDLKPANILLTDEGQPMLLDFNLAEDTKRRSSASAALLGGTLPYMSPEQLRALRGEHHPLDGRSDLYSLGVILYELLTGRHPFPSHSGPPTAVVESMAQDREVLPPPLRTWNRAVTPAIESIVRRCLEPEPQRRYQGARELQEDLQSHLESLPLRHAGEPSLRERARKWTSRHPRLASLGTVGLLATALLASLTALLLYHHDRLDRLEAIVQQSLNHPREVPPDRGLRIEDRRSTNAVSRSSILDPQSSIFDPQSGEDGDLAEGVRLEPGDEQSWNAHGLPRLANDPEGALADFACALEVNPSSLAALNNQAHVLAEVFGRTEEAITMLDRTLALYPDQVAARVNRGVLLARLGRRAAAHEDAVEALRRSSAPAVLYRTASVYALTSRQHPTDRHEALRLLAGALQQGYGLEMIQRDPDLASLQGGADFRRLVEAARTLRDTANP